MWPTQIWSGNKSFMKWYLLFPCALSSDVFCLFCSLLKSRAFSQVRYFFSSKCWLMSPGPVGKDTHRPWLRNGWEQGEWRSYPLAWLHPCEWAVVYVWARVCVCMCVRAHACARVCVGQGWDKGEVSEQNLRGVISINLVTKMHI